MRYSADSSDVWRGVGLTAQLHRTILQLVRTPQQVSILVAAAEMRMTAILGIPPEADCHLTAPFQPLLLITGTDGMGRPIDVKNAQCPLNVRPLCFERRINSKCGNRLKFNNEGGMHRSGWSLRCCSSKANLHEKGKSFFLTRRGNASCQNYTQVSPPSGNDLDSGYPVGGNTFAHGSDHLGPPRSHECLDAHYCPPAGRLGALPERLVPCRNASAGFQPWKTVGPFPTYIGFPGPKASPFLRERRHHQRILLIVAEIAP